MSADRWSKCPKCIRLHNEDVEADSIALVAAYGTVDADEFLRMKAALDNKIGNGISRDMLREDYELWMDDNGVFSVNYKAICGTCGFKYEYDKSEKAL